MRITLDKIREKYSNANYPPSTYCQICKGEGEWYDERQGKFIQAGMRPCICIYVEHEFASTVNQMLSQLAKDELEKIKSQKNANK